jgi:hypothetical protein
MLYNVVDNNVDAIGLQLRVRHESRVPHPTTCGYEKRTVPS